MCVLVFCCCKTRSSLTSLRVGAVPLLAVRVTAVGQRGARRRAARRSWWRPGLLQGHNICDFTHTHRTISFLCEYTSSYSLNSNSFYTLLESCTLTGECGQVIQIITGTFILTNILFQLVSEWAVSAEAAGTSNLIIRRCNVSVMTQCTSLL